MTKEKKAAIIYVSLSLGATICLSLLSCWLAYVELGNLPSGSEVRPIRLAIEQQAITAASFAVSLALSAILFQASRERRVIWLLLIVMLAASCLPWKLGHIVADEIIVKNGLIVG